MWKCEARVNNITATSDSLCKYHSLLIIFLIKKRETVVLTDAENPVQNTISSVLALGYNGPSFLSRG